MMKIVLALAHLIDHQEDVDPRKKNQPAKYQSARREQKLDEDVFFADVRV